VTVLDVVVLAVVMAVVAGGYYLITTPAPSCAEPGAQCGELLRPD